MKSQLHAIIIHGTMGNPEANWFPWLATELKRLGVAVSIPQFPTPEGQNLKNWFERLQREVGEIQPHHLLIGHSVGATFVLRILEQVKSPIRGAFLVAGFAELLRLPEIDPYISTFVEEPFNWDLISKKAEILKVYNGDDDPYVPLEFGRKVAEAIGVELTVIEKGGHINASSGFLTFKQLLSDVRLVVSP